MSENGEIYTDGKNFTLPPALTNSTSGSLLQKIALYEERNIIFCSPAQVALLKVCLHLNQPGWERTELVVATDDTDCLKIIGEVEEKLRRYSKDGLVSKSSNQPAPGQSS